MWEMLDYRIVTVCEYRHAYRALLPVEGEGEDEGRTQSGRTATKTPHLSPLLGTREADLLTLEK